MRASESIQILQSKHHESSTEVTTLMGDGAQQAIDLTGEFSNGFTEKMSL
jgi:hypothetical protein